MGSQYAESVMSQSTTYSTTKGAHATDMDTKRSTRQKLRSVLSRVGHPPTAKHDAKHNKKPVDAASLSFMPVYASRL